MKTVDARGLPCPKPVMMAKQALDEEEKISVLVSERSSADNVAEMARSSGATAIVEESDGSFKVTIERKPAPLDRSHVEHLPAAETPPGAKTAVVWVVNSDSIGRGDDELGRLLRKSFFGAMAEIDSRPEKIVFINSGVKLVATGSPVLESLGKLEGSGVEILACGTCLDFYSLKDKVAVGKVSNMYNFIELLMEAGKVVTF